MIRFFAAHATLANLLMAGFLALGLFAAPTLLRETFPRVEPRRVQITVAYPGARPADVEEAICQRLEDAIDAVSNVYELSCEALEGRAVAVVEMVEGTDLDRFLGEVKTEVEAIASFPEDAEAPVVKPLGRSDFVASLAITGPQDRAHLKAYAEQVKARMLAMGGIPQVAITGFSDHQFRVELFDDALRQFGLSVADIADAIARQSLDLPAGSIETRDGDILIRFSEERRSLQALADLIVVSGAGGGLVRLGDIARISDRFDLAEDKILFNGKPAAMLDITKTENEDTLSVIDRLRQFVAVEKARAPPTVDLVITNDASSIVRDRLNLLLKNGAQGLVLVFLAMWVFFGLRYALWIALGLPVSFAGALALMALFGYSINMLTMVGLLIVIGLLMDDAIVISENIATRYAAGRPPLEAAVEGARQVLPGVMSSFATTACIFGSLAFLKGDIGAVLKVVPVVMLAVLVISIIEAFLILPQHLAHALHHGAGEQGRVQQAAERLIAWLRKRAVGPFVDWAVRGRYATVGVAIGLLLFSLSAMAGGWLKFSAFPELDGDVLEARILLPQGTPLARTEAVAAHVVAALRQVEADWDDKLPDGQRLVRNIAIKFNHNKDAHEHGPHVATVSVDLLPAEQRVGSNDALLAAWRQAVGERPDVLALKFTEPASGPAGIAIDIRLQGADLAALKRASQDMQAWLRRYRGVHDISDDLRPGKLELNLRLKDAALSLGVDARRVADQLRKAFFGVTVSEVQVGPEAYEINVRLAKEDRDSLADLDDFTISLPGGDLVPLHAVAVIEQQRGYARINRINRVRTVTIQGDVDVRLANANEIIADMRSRFLPAFEKRHPQVRVLIEGQDKEAGTTQKSMISGFILGLFGVFLLLSFQFRSYIEPLVVMIVIPFAFIGVIFGHLLMGLDFTMPSMLGFVALAGVVVNDSILLVNFIKDRHGPGMTVSQAAPLAARARFRAILLTSVTTIAGLLPILAETSLQAQILVPLVTSLAFGLLASTVLVLVLVPAIYAILDDFGLSTLAREKAAQMRAGLYSDQAGG